MATYSRVAQWETSLAIRIPKPLAEELELQAGTACGTQRPERPPDRGQEGP